MMIRKILHSSSQKWEFAWMWLLALGLHQYSKHFDFSSFGLSNEEQQHFPSL